MDTPQIFKKAFQLVWRYRATWLFGFLLALTMSNSLWLFFARNDEEEVVVMVKNRIILPDDTIIYFPGEGLVVDFRTSDGPTVRIEGLEPGWYQELTGDYGFGDIRAFLISLGFMLLVIFLLANLFRYTSQAALIRMVDEYARSDQRASLRHGLRLGWSRVAWKLFGIDLVINLPLAIFFSLLFLLALSPFLLFRLERAAESDLLIVGVILLAAVGLLLFGFFVFLSAVLLSVTRPVMHQACGVDGLSVIASIRLGFGLLRRQLKEVGITWLVSLAVRLSWTILSIPVFFFLLPVLLITILVGVVICAIPAALVAGIASLFASTPFAWAIGVIFALPLFGVIAFLPLLFLEGLVAVFRSSFWTLSYRAFRPMTVADPKTAAEHDEARSDPVPV